MNFQNMKLDLLLHSLVFKLAQADDEEEREFLIEIWQSAMETRQDFLDEMKRMDDDHKKGSLIFKPKAPLSDEEKAERRLELKQRNSKWN